MKRIPLHEYCEKKISTLSPQHESYIDYIDISSVDNLEKKIINIQQLTTEEAPSRAKQLLQVGDILVSTVRPNLNAVAMVEQNSKNILVGSTGYCVLRCKNNINNRYVFHFCQSLYFVDDMVKQATGASYPAVNSNIVKNSLIPEYTEEKQNEIVITLDKTDNLIYERKKQLSKLDELVKARFIEMFGSEENKGYLLDLCEFINGDRGKNYPSRSDVVSSGVPFINAGHLEQNRISFDNMNYLTEDKYKSLNSGKIQKNDILYCLRGSLGKKALVDIDKGAIASSLVILRPDTEKIIPSFLLYSLEQPYIIEQMNKANNGSSQPNLSAQSVKAYEIILPPIEQQIEFDTFIQQLEKSKFEIQQSLEKLETLKKSLMQQYFG